MQKVSSKIDFAGWNLPRKIDPEWLPRFIWRRAIIRRVCCNSRGKSDEKTIQLLHANGEEFELLG
jgi:hypothetical protein